MESENHVKRVLSRESKGGKLEEVPEIPLSWSVAWDFPSETNGRLMTP
jgi:hypothetical protein